MARTTRTRWILETLAVSALALASPAGAETFLVDDDGGPGVDFTDIQPAIDAAQPGDVVLVEPGSYSAFLLAKSLTIIGAEGANVPGTAWITGIPAGGLAVLADLAVRDAHVRDCDGPVVLDRLSFPYDLPTGPAGIEQFVEVVNTLDARLFRCAATAAATGDDQDLLVLAARAEVVESRLWRSRRGLSCDVSARVHLAASDALGEDGYDDPDGLCSDPWDPSNWAGDGGAGCFVDGASELFVAGRAADRIQGGRAGIGCDCEHDGYAAPGVDVHSGFARWSGVTIEAGTTLPDCTAHGAEPVEGPNLEALPADPILVLVGTPAPGGQVRCVVRGTPGAQARLFLGRRAVVESQGGVGIERLTSEERVVTLGAIPAGGYASLQLDLPLGLQPGLSFFAQAETTLTGDVRRTNSVPLVVR